MKPPYTYMEKPYKGFLPEIINGGKDTGSIPNKVDKFPRVGEIPKLPPLPSIEEQEGGTCDIMYFVYHVTDWRG